MTPKEICEAVNQVETLLIDSGGHTGIVTVLVRMPGWRENESVTLSGQGTPIEMLSRALEIATRRDDHVKDVFEQA